MTREDYINNVNDWSDFISFCYDEGYDDFVDDIYYTDTDSIEELINDDLNCYLENGYGWRDLREVLNDVENVVCHYDYVRGEGCLCYEGLDEVDFESYKQELLERIDELEEWEDEDDGEIYEINTNNSTVVNEDEEEFDDTPIEPEDVSFEELMISSSEIVNNILPIVNDAVDESDILEILR